MKGLFGSRPELPEPLRETLPAVADLDVTEQATSWATYATPFVRRWRLFVAVFVLTFLCVVGFTLTRPKAYTTTMKLMAGNPSEGAAAPAGATLPVLNAILGMSGQESAETYADLLQEPPLAQAVVDELKLPIDSGKLLQRTTVKPVTNTAIVSLSVTWSDPQLAARLANAFGDVFVRQQRELVQGQADAALAFLNRQLPLAERRMRIAQRAQVEYLSAAGIANVDTQTQTLLQRIATIEGRIGDEQVSERQTAGALQAVDGILAGVAATAPGEQSRAPNALRSQLQSALAQNELQLREAEGKYTSAHPTVVALRLQERTLKDEIARQAQSVVVSSITAPNPLYRQLAEQRASLLTQQQSGLAQLHELRKQQKKLVPELAKSPYTAARIVELKREVQEAEAVYAELRAKYNEASLERTTIPSAVAVVVRATADGASVTPSLRVNMIVGLLLGLGLATTAVYIAHLLDRTVKDDRDAEHDLGLPVLARIPSLQTGRERGLEVFDAFVGEAFQQLIWSLRYSSVERLRSVAVTSATPGDGKSTIAVNVAAAFADTFGAVLLIDGDLRRPSLHSKLNLPRGYGLADILAGTATLEQVVRPTSRPGLFFLSAGTPTPSPIKLLQSDRFTQLLEHVCRTYAMVVVDTPALNVIFDGAVLSAKADATVMVVSAGSTETAQAKRALRKLRASKARSLTGLVLNRAKPRDGETTYYESYTDETQVVLPPEHGTIV